ncbi:short-chain dehydrogenase/reductase SDR [Thermobaculum terrenum ATCC BAA-798]|uniref:Short-chain dehydrogenase/reductase SDR n=1 Tax=Thermobaculum terrenum (strain ATCC BAA-798 / CCMEE 7001 / YNP1) TaxID=525904 RepID=D1CGK1_THET1|nr:SDR family NAD(P)-dependent oxidoreductase [Thermobaculum terrenum]ACZ42872.1 short-chain dehydrogenase/reductase SDR [Thermobaculum terrenum ATCC BAA-798]
MRLDGKVAVITGAASGIGRGTAEVFAEHGARLVLVDLDAEGLAGLVGQLKAGGAEVVGISGDVSHKATAVEAVGAALRQYGRIDVVFNNAGVMYSGAFHELGDDLWDRVLDVNLRGTYLFCREAIPHMLEQGRGSIINMSSVMATLTEPGYEAYTTSKAGIIGLTKAIAVSYAERGIRCNCVCPGWVDTPLNRRLAEELGGMDRLNALIKQQQPNGRMLSTREVANAVLFLASDESSGVTGAAIYVDGGASSAI